METYITFTQNEIDDMDSQTKPLSWEELKEKAKEMGCVLKYEGKESELLEMDTSSGAEIAFYKNGKIKAFMCEDRIELLPAGYCTYDKMLMIMRGLE